MRKPMFKATEQFLGEAMKEQLLQSMSEAGEQEKSQAIANNHFHQGVPYISVVADGGWSKRSHKHSYNAKSGVAVIFGLHTKRLLFLGVRNKYCSVCAVAEHRGKQAPHHICYRNWSGSSCAMESDIVAQGFQLSEATHGIRYLKLVGDGDSSVMATIHQSVPYGTYVEKIECANHAVKCYRSRLEELARDNPQYRGKGGLTKRAIQRLTVGARIAIRMHSKTRNVQQLRHDLRNGPAHVFGDHTSCNPQFCKHVEQESQLGRDVPFRQEETAHSGHSRQNEEVSNHANQSEICQSMSLAEQIASIAATELESEPTPEEEATARTGHSASLSSLPDGLFRKVLACGDRLVMLAPQLIDNLTSNLAEYYMGLRTICDGGKQYNRIQAGSFKHRCYTAGLQAQNGPEWKVKFWEETTGQPPCQVKLYMPPMMCSNNIHFTIITIRPIFMYIHILTMINHTHSFIQIMKAAGDKHALQLNRDKVRKQSEPYQQRQRSAKYSGIDTSLQHHYGVTAQQPDISQDELKVLCDEYYAREIVDNSDEAGKIERETRKQSDSILWYHHRRLRLTASNFGAVAKRRSTTPVANTVKTLLYTKSAATKALRWGHSHEDDARQAYVQFLCKTNDRAAVSTSGLVVDVTEPCLACSPDGLVHLPGNPEPYGVVELKCPYSAAEKGLTPHEAAESLKAFPCKLTDDGSLWLNRNHNYYHQVQGLLAITQCP